MAEAKKKFFNKSRAIKFIFAITALLVTVAVIFPIVWAIPASMKTKEIFQVPAKFFPDKFTFENFRKVFEQNAYNIDFVSTLFSTFGVAISAVALSLIINMLAAYAFSRLEFPFKKVLFGIVMLSMFIPGITILLTSIRIVDAMGLIDTFLVLVLPGAANAYNIFFFRQFFFGLPSSLEEAAIIDGSTHWGIFFKIFIPLSVTPIIIIGTSVFMGYWNSYLWPTLTIIHNTGLKQVMQVIKVLSGGTGMKTGITIAATVMSLAIPTVMFAIFQKYIIGGIAISGIK